jgi:hypothetical protein
MAPSATHRWSGPSVRVQAQDSGITEPGVGFLGRHR